MKLMDLEESLLILTPLVHFPLWKQIVQHCTGRITKERIISVSRNILFPLGPLGYLWGTSKSIYSWQHRLGYASVQYVLRVKLYISHNSQICSLVLCPSSENYLYRGVISVDSYGTYVVQNRNVLGE